MADAMIGPPNINWVDKRAVQGSASSPLTNPSDFRDHTTIKAKLVTLAAGTFTQTYMNQLTPNDLVYALRVLEEAGGI
jgi:hypothetical protein